MVTASDEHTYCVQEPAKLTTKKNKFGMRAIKFNVIINVTYCFFCSTQHFMLQRAQIKKSRKLRIPKWNEAIATSVGRNTNKLNNIQFEYEAQGPDEHWKISRTIKWKQRKDEEENLNKTHHISDDYCIYSLIFSLRADDADEYEYKRNTRHSRKPE